MLHILKVGIPVVQWSLPQQQQKSTSCHKDVQHCPNNMDLLYNPSHDRDLLTDKQQALKIEHGIQKGQLLPDNNIVKGGGNMEVLSPGTKSYLEELFTSNHKQKSLDSHISLLLDKTIDLPNDQQQPTEIEYGIQKGQSPPDNKATMLCPRPPSLPPFLAPKHFLLVYNIIKIIFILI